MPIRALAFFVALPAPLAPNAQPSPTPRPAALLSRVLHAADRIAFEARQASVTPSGGRAQATVTEEARDGQGRSRIRYLMPRSAAGREVVNDGRWVWEYNPSDRVAVRYPNTAVHAISATSDRILRSYTVAVGPAPATWIGRRAWLLRIRPNRPDRPRYVWWVDAATGLVLKREEFDARGALREVSSYQRITVMPSSRRPVIRFRPPPGVQVAYRSARQAALTLSAARRLTPSWARPPAPSLGDGFEFDSAQAVTLKGTPGLQVQYSDGLTLVSLTQMPGAAHLPGDGHVVRSVQLAGRPATLMQMPPFRILSWRSEGTTFSLVADLGEATLLDIGRRLQ